MRDFKTYLSVAPVVSTLWFGSLAGLLIEINQKLLESNLQRRVMAKVVFERVLIRDQEVFSDILLKTIDTIRLVSWNCKNSVPIVTNIQFMER
ncbi:Photosystem I reaction center subunit IX [Bienertia sinuspersici]